MIRSDENVLHNKMHLHEMVHNFASLSEPTWHLFVETEWKAWSKMSKSAISNPETKACIVITQILVRFIFIYVQYGNAS